ncbi:2-dehydropantoate 2-reductase [Plenodomus tracheiphilus IPT5]|uniref:2-dehydropantoate 2-reductase n=1 Tax=Plenodomus tracheiphilus IPT5 TaxID=1408161 RepID=A0A6A7B7A8_9PLEO|nr:2-dehydropantoate 2-reductase [Plenodomus tracheiphilus IPT5]
MTPSPIHILGLGNLGKLLAHSLRKHHPKLPITLLFHRPSLLEEWNGAGRSIEIVRGGVSDTQSGFSHEDVSHNGSQIQQLIVATKTHATAKALQPLRGRLSPTSTLLFLQNGIGTIDEVNTQVFPDPSSRPNYLAGIFNHGVYATSPFSSVHAGIADAVIGPVRSSNSPTNPPPHLHNSALAHAIIACPELSTSLVSAQDLLHTQLQKLTINAVINPLTVLFGCKNGKLFSNKAICTLIEHQIREISMIVKTIIATSHPSSTESSVLAKFDVDRLRALVFDVGRKTAGNISSMRQDRLAGRKTEIDYINGYLVAQAGKAGVACPLNTRIVQLVKDGEDVSSERIGEVFGVALQEG